MTALLVDVVIHNLLDEVNVGEHHTPAAVPVEAHLVEHLPLAH
eukprot:CAMPEP_0180420596 /NCGR_PEP_ID=MMETSP1036_2-20121128/2713_1 /TAXON_ID=632150 /ORGANISM="Azadinium spinosum, Strain 3D9" /LENGTH=42 /DNA_ID= /DNA_START= /DNA_END= /DNA_ORIENTATION=